MKILVYPHDLVVGGSQINAIDLARAVTDLGHEAIIYSLPGPLERYIESKGLRYFPAHPLKYRPAPTRIWELVQLARRERIDVIHGYEWPPCLDAYFGAHLATRVPVVCTVLSMSLVPLVPPSVPLVMGTRELFDHAVQTRGGRVSLIEPTVDTVRDNPDVPGWEFRRQHGVMAEEPLLVIVSRLSIDLKLDALLGAVDAVDILAARFPVRLLIVGTGDAAGLLAARAERVNSAHGRRVVELPGPLLDPRPAYSAADIVLGMGSSALRAMAFEKPVVVQGERGFSEVFEPGTSERFYRQGFYGVGDGRSEPDVLAGQIERLLTDAHLRRRLGVFGRQAVSERYGLGAAAGLLVEIYEAVRRLSASPLALAREAPVVALRALANEAKLHLPAGPRHRRAGSPRPPTAVCS